MYRISDVSCLSGYNKSAIGLPFFRRAEVTPLTAMPLDRMTRMTTCASVHKGSSLLRSLVLVAYTLYEERYNGRVLDIGGKAGNLEIRISKFSNVAGLGCLEGMVKKELFLLGGTEKKLKKNFILILPPTTTE